ncbi:MAG TPA: hypothetical protein VG755_09115 [Nannocystaceae bacterium]|nr:hypothetical protein [Nannocystaceae bacterium]
MGRLVFFAIAVVLVRIFGLANKEETRPGFFLLAQWIVLASAALVAVMLVRQGQPLGFVMLPLVAVLMFPWPLARRFAIPRGRWRMAWFLTRASAWTWYDDNKGGATVAAAWAATKARDRARAIAFVEKQCEGDAGPATLFATGLLAQARGDLPAARRWVASLCEFEGKVAPRMARSLALEWCAAEAASRGAWEQIPRWADDREATAATKFLGAVARRLTAKAPVPSDDELRRLAKRMPKSLQPLLARALAAASEATPTTEPIDVPAPPPIPEGSPHEIALQLHARLLAADAKSVRMPALDRVTSAWDRLLRDAAFVASVRTRASALGTDVDAIAKLRERIDRDLLDVVWAGDVAIGEDELVPGRSTSRWSEDTFGRLRSRLHQRALDELEVAADTLHARAKARRALPIHEEWREWLALRGAYERAVAMTGIRLRRLAFEAVHGPACALAAWLWNDRKQRTHAHQMFRWLLREAEIVDDAEAIALQRRNVDCGS